MDVGEVMADDLLDVARLPGVLGACCFFPLPNPEAEEPLLLLRSEEV